MLLSMRTRPYPLSPAKAIGVSLIELLVFIVVMGLAAVSLSTLYQHRLTAISTPMIQHQLLLMAQSHLSEINGRRYDERMPVDGMPCGIELACLGIGLDAGESFGDKHSLDDIDDFDDYTDQPQRGVTRQVRVSYAGEVFGLDQPLAKRISVSVTASTGEHVQVSIYRINY